MRAGLATVAVMGALLIQAVSSPAMADDAEKGKAPALPPVPSHRYEEYSCVRSSGVPFLEADLGLAYVAPLALKDAELLDSERVKVSGFGFTYSAALGARVGNFSFAARYRSGDFSDWQLWSLGGEAGMALRLDFRNELHFGVGAGYASLGGTVADVSRATPPRPAPDIDIDGLNVRAKVGVHQLLAKLLSVGANLSADAYFLHRKGDRLERTASAEPSSSSLFPYAADGAGRGLGVTLSLVLTLRP